MSDEQQPPMSCLIHEGKIAEFGFETGREIAEFGIVRFGLCKHCNWKKKHNPDFSVKVMNKLNSVLLAQRNKPNGSEPSKE